MAITTYQELQDAVGNWLNRPDLTLRIPEFIAMAEARMAGDSRLRVQDAVLRDTLAATSQFTALPDKFKRMINCELIADPVVPLTYATPQQMDAYRNRAPTGDPVHYCIVGTEIELVPVTTSATLGIIYYQSVPSLSDAAPTNWLLTARPDIYLYATLMESAPFLLHDERVQTWGMLYDQRAGEYHQSSEADQTAGSPLVVRGPTLG